MIVTGVLEYVAALTALIGLLLLLAALHPFVTYPLSLMLFRRRHVADALPAEVPPGERPSVAICMSAYNEEAVIVEKVAALLDQAALYGPATVNIYADGCSDRTVELLQPFTDRIQLIVSKKRTGKTEGMRQLIEATGSDLLMFTDANVHAPADALVLLARRFADPSIGCVTVRLAYSNRDETPTSFLGALYWRIEEGVKSLEDATVGVIGVDGAMFAVRRANYHAPPPSLIDDLYVSLRVLIDGLRVTRAPEVVVAERSATGPGEEYRRKVRIACQAMNVHRALWPVIRRGKAQTVYAYVSHRLMKWMVPFTLLGAILCFTVALVLHAGISVLLILIGSVAALLLLAQLGGLRAPGMVWASITGIAGVGRGVLESLVARRTYTVWEPATSVRAGDKAEESRITVH